MLDILVADQSATVAATKGLGVAKLLLRSCYSSTHHLSLTEFYADQSTSSISSTAGALQISAVIFPIDAVAPPTVKPNTYRIPRRTLLRRKRRTKRKLSGGSDDNGGDEGFFFGDGGAFGGGGSFGGGGGGGGGSGGGGWNFDRFGEGHNWDESSSSHSDPAFDFVYQVLSWIVLSNCLHFALKKIIRIVTDGMVDADREKVQRRLAPIC